MAEIVTATAGGCGYTFAMRRFGRSLFMLASMMSLLLFLTVGALWVRAAKSGDVFSKLGPRGIELTSYRGEIALWIYSGVPFSTPLRHQSGNSSMRHTDTGNYAYVGESGGVRSYWLVSRGIGFTNYQLAGVANAPVKQAFWSRWATRHWFIALVTAPLPIALITQLARARAARRRAMAGLCRYCGYDLRASPGRCPECGVSADAATANPPSARLRPRGSR
jgi:hypothetical protein